MGGGQGGLRPRLQRGLSAARLHASDPTGGMHERMRQGDKTQKPRHESPQGRSFHAAAFPPRARLVPFTSTTGTRPQGLAPVIEYRIRNDYHITLIAN